MEPIPTLRWTDGSLRILDQRLLPGEEQYIDCSRVEELADCIKTLAIRGAPAIGIAAAYGAVIAAMNGDDDESFPERVSAKLDLLEGTRPTAVNLFNCVRRQREILQQARGREEAVELLLLQANRFFEEDLESSRAMGGFGADLLQPDSVLLTHCNAGGLATAGLGTALAVVYEAADRGWVKRVYADETRPLLQGARLTAWELCRAGIPVRVLPDSAAASLLGSGEIDAVLVGADRVTVNGDVANKIGTYPLALAAREAGVPFYVVAPLSSFDPDTREGGGIEIEHRGREELELAGGRSVLPERAEVYNPAFDVTPSSLVTALITEKGILK
jgi:methylthioribose-1-phosphate isomerase